MYEHMYKHIYEHMYKQMYEHMYELHMGIFSACVDMSSWAVRSNPARLKGGYFLNLKKSK
jgi:hypothetical protein